jgi:hypothetical protein
MGFLRRFGTAFSLFIVFSRQELRQHKTIEALKDGSKDFY